MSSSSRIICGHLTYCFSGWEGSNKDLERYDVKNFINCNIEVLNIWCHNTFGGPNYGMINALGQAINERKASPTNWISEVGTDTWTSGSRTSSIVTYAYWGSRGIPWIVSPPSSCRPKATMCEGSPSINNSY